MKVVIDTKHSLEQFLRLPYIEESPAWEFIYGEAIQQTDAGREAQPFAIAFGGCDQCRNF